MRDREGLAYSSTSAAEVAVRWLCGGCTDLSVLVTIQLLHSGCVIEVVGWLLITCDAVQTLPRLRVVIVHKREELHP